jgi:hypothetical protein
MNKPFGRQLVVEVGQPAKFVGVTPFCGQFGELVSCDLIAGQRQPPQLA